MRGVDYRGEVNVKSQRVAMMLFSILFTVSSLSSVDAFTLPCRSSRRNNFVLGRDQCSSNILNLESSFPLFATSPEFGLSDNHPEMAFEREGSASGGGSRTVPDRAKKHQGRKKKSVKRKKKNKNSSPTSTLTEDDIAHHVAGQYIRGKKGVLTNSRRNNFFDAMNSEDKSQMKFLNKLNNLPALVLNADYQPLSHLPLSLWSWQDSVKAVFSEKVTVVDVYSNVLIRAVNLEMELPSVIALNEYVPQASNQRPSFTRRNVFLRDGYRCQYCNNLFKSGELSLDHVVPRSMGGQLCWDNAVTCCKTCNGKKGSVHVSELKSVGMKLLREPRTPTQYELALEAGKMLPRKVHPTWAPFVAGATVVTEKNEAGTRSIYEED